MKILRNQSAVFLFAQNQCNMTTYIIQESRIPFPQWPGPYTCSEISKDRRQSFTFVLSVQNTSD